MPELPEVETLRQELAEVLVGKTIKSVAGNWPKMVRPWSLRRFTVTLRGKKIKAVERRAKVLIISLSSDLYLLIHLKMTGQLIFAPKKGRAVAGGHPQKGGLDNLPNKYTHLWFDFTDGAHLYFNDLRKFGWTKLVDEKGKTKIFADTGIEPLSTDFTLKNFQAILKRYPKRKIKQLLMDQTLIAGVGNIYADEGCFLAKIRPTRQVSSLKKEEIKAMHLGIISVLKHSISKKGTSTRNYRRSDGSLGGFVPYLNVYGRGKDKCKRCGTPISKIRLNGRGTHFCPKCQR